MWKPSSQHRHAKDLHIERTLSPIVANVMSWFYMDDVANTDCQFVDE